MIDKKKSKIIYTLRRTWSVGEDRNWRRFSRYIGLKVYKISQQKACVKVVRMKKTTLRKLTNQYNRKFETDIKLL